MRFAFDLCLLLIYVQLGESFFILPNLDFLKEPLVPHAKAKRSTDSQTASYDNQQKCSDAEIEDLQSDLTVCMKGKITKGLQKILNDEKEYISITCQTMKEELECVDQYAPRCLDEERIELLKTQALLSVKKYVDQNPTIFGDKFIESCPALQGINKRYARSNFGNDECSFDELQNLKSERDGCIKKVQIELITTHLNNVQAISKPEDFSARNLMFASVCKAKEDQLKCYEDTVFKCTSQEVKDRVLKLEDEEFSIYEKEILKAFNFKFDKCATY